ncbi:hypothetical protein Scep_015498 [Stephania cephalantha]|uniref:Uncharacterized protein n=1 Tax=Stephania cephalantha TaxID=152367 RepID=A0AAP0P0F3_9MAGN
MEVTTAPTQPKRSSSRLRKMKKPTVPPNTADTSVLIKYDDDKADGRLQPLQSDNEMQKCEAMFFARAPILTKMLDFESQNIFVRSVFDKKGWLNFVETKHPFTANFVVYFYAHLHTPDPQNTSLLCSEINCCKIEITHALIRRLFKLPVGLKKAYGHQQLSKKMGFDIVEASKYLLHYCATYVAGNPSKKKGKARGVYSYVNHLGKLFVEMGLPPPSKHEYEEVLRDRVDVIGEKNFEKMVYIQSEPEESVDDDEEMSIDDDDCDDFSEDDSEEGSDEEGDEFMGEDDTVYEEPVHSEEGHTHDGTDHQGIMDKLTSLEGNVEEIKVVVQQTCANLRAQHKADYDTIKEEVAKLVEQSMERWQDKFISNLALNYD